MAYTIHNLHLKSLTPILFLAYTLLPQTSRAQVQEICLFNGGWNLCFESNGSVQGVYNAMPETCIQIKEGTVDFQSMLAKINKAEQTPTLEIGKFQISIQQKDQVSAPAFTLKDNSILETILALLVKQWVSCAPEGLNPADKKADKG